MYERICVLDASTSRTMQCMQAIDRFDLFILFVVYIQLVFIYLDPTGYNFADGI